MSLIAERKYGSLRKLVFIMISLLAIAVVYFGMDRFALQAEPEQVIVNAELVSEVERVAGGNDLFGLGRFDEALAWYEKALEVEPRNAATYFEIGRYHFMVSGKLDQAVVWLRKSISVDPDSSMFFVGPYYVPAWLAWIYLDLGDLDRAEHWIEQSLELAPESFDVNFAMQILRLYREDESSLDYARNAMVNFPNFWPPRAFLRNHELAEGRPAEARALYERTSPELLSEDEPAIDEENFLIAIELALVLIRTGEQERADLLLDRSLEYIQTIPRLGDGYWVADVQIYALKGDKQRALSALRQAIDEGWRGLWWYFLKQNPNLESLHDEPEFQAMVAEIEADMAEQLARVREMERNGELKPIPEASATTQ
jgi:tetratricopeptide (TPR) repeat protein